MTCPACSRYLDPVAETLLFPVRLPGEVGVCPLCGAFLVLRPDLELVERSEEELRSLVSPAQMAALEQRRAVYLRS